MKRYFHGFGSSVLALSLLVGMCLTVGATPHPLHLVEHGQLSATPRDPSGTVLDVVAHGTGNATHLGAITVERTATLTATDTPGIFDFEGDAILTSASGDQLFTEIHGTFNGNTGHADLVYEWTGGTGRFENATGLTFWSVEVAPNGDYDVVANGQLIY